MKNEQRERGRRIFNGDLCVQRMTKSVEKFFWFCAAIFLLAGCSCGADRDELFIPPEGEHIYAGGHVGEDAVYLPRASSGGELWSMELFRNPNSNTPHDFLVGPAELEIRFFYYDAPKVIALFEDELFCEMGLPFPAHTLMHRDGVRYNFSARGQNFFDEYGREIGVITLWHEGTTPVRLEILTLAEVEAREGFFDSFEAAAYALGSDFRLPTEHMEMYGPPAFAAWSGGWMSDYDGLIVIYEAEDRPEIFGRRSAALIIDISPLGERDVEYYIERRLGWWISPDAEIERHEVADTVIYRLVSEDVRTPYMWAHNGLLYSLIPPGGFNITNNAFYELFTEEEFLELIGSMVW
ncbi:MAG: hypothetical protein FWF77_01340 [Defluviitaleaceae bacterium]|nr:hypothetical protein [Defluviitaleaceae bacterium]